MNQLQAISQVSLKEMLRPREVGNVVVSHVFDYAQQPKPDFAEMQRVISAPSHEQANTPSTSTRDKRR